MEFENKMLYLSKAHENSLNAIKQADNKANISITIQSFLVSIGLASSLLLGTFEKAATLAENQTNLKIAYFIFVGIFIIISIAGIIGSISVYFPIVKPEEKQERNRNGYLFYRHIQNYSTSDNYLEEFSKISEKDLIIDLGKQAFTISKLANRKMCLVKLSIGFLVSSVILCLLVLILSGLIAISGG